MMLVTAFGPFANIKRNPSEVIARALFGDKAVILPVTFAAVDAFLGNIPKGTERLLMLGVGRGDRRIRIERTASDRIGAMPDADGVSMPREKTESITGALLRSVSRNDCWEESEDAGGYLCNYIYFEATKKHPAVATGFIHVPPFSVVPLPIQAVRLKRIINLISQ